QKQIYTIRSYGMHVFVLRRVKNKNQENAASSLLEVQDVDAFHASRKMLRSISCPLSSSRLPGYNSFASLQFDLKKVLLAGLLLAG
ncbi:MAG: hypothetical protein AAF483_22965, partial [Planctomycetota bacterium]